MGITWTLRSAVGKEVQDDHADGTHGGCGDSGAARIDLGPWKQMKRSNRVDSPSSVRERQL